MAKRNRKIKSGVNPRFSKVPDVKIPRSSFDRSHGLKTTFNSSDLVPVFVDTALPGDTFNLNMTAFARLATPLKPILDNLYLETFFFAVPIRLVWDNWEKFNGAQDSPGDSTDFLIPQFTNDDGVARESIHDYMGVPPEIAGLDFNALHARAYNLIYNEWFRDENLQEPAFITKGDSGGTPVDQFYPMRKRGKRHDYFTSALPWPQKGDAVTIPLGSSAPVLGIGKIPGSAASQIDQDVRESNEQDTTYPFSTLVDGSAAAEQHIFVKGLDGLSGTPDIWADLSEATAITINALREGFQIQRMLERDARGGTRYTEVIRSHFGVTSPDARLQRPEYLGGGSTPINIAPVPQTSSSDDGPGPTDTPQGNLAAVGTAVINRHGFTKSFTEHTLLIGLVNVRADLTYQQGLNRDFSRQTRYDFYWPTLAHLGEQSILNKEIYAQGTPEDNETWAFQERYAEYRYKPSMLTGKMRSSDPESLDVWHLAQDFANLPTLSSEFITEDVPIDRVVAVPSEPDFLLDVHFGMRCARPMPMYGVPGLIDHF